MQDTCHFVFTHRSTTVAFYDVSHPVIVMSNSDSSSIACLPEAGFCTRIQNNNNNKNNNKQQATTTTTTTTKGGLFADLVAGRRRGFSLTHTRIVIFSGI
jgi:hypothetical protein